MPAGCAVAVGSRACTTAAASGRCSPTWPPTSTCPSPDRLADRRAHRRLLDPGMEARTPWTPGDRDRRRRDLPGAFAAFADDPEVGQRVLRRHDPPGRALERGLSADLDRPFRGDRQAVLRLLQPASAVSGRGQVLRDRGIPVLEGTRAGAGAAASLRDAAWRARPPARRRPRRRRGPGAWRARLSEACRCPSWAAALLADYGCRWWPPPGGDGRRRSTPLDATVPRRGEDGGLGHHAQVRCRGVRIGCPADAVRDAYEDIAGRLGPEAVVAAWRPGSRSRSVVVIRPSARWCWCGGRRARSAARPRLARSARRTRRGA